MSTTTRLGPATALIHTGDRPAAAAPLTTPIYETTTFVFESAAELEKYLRGGSGTYMYSRYENPTVVAAEEKIASLEGAEEAVLFASGMAATSTALLTLLAPGDEIVASASLYGGTYHFIHEFLTRFGIAARFVPLAALQRLEDHLGPRTRTFFFETPTNPTLRVVDIARVTEACRARGVLTIIDNTFATPLNQRPVDLGVDIVMHSVTKYLNGHSDVTGGVIAGPRARMAQVRSTRRVLGGVMDPAAAYGLARGMKTLAVRLARHNATAQAVAEALERNPRVERVYYPGLASHPDHAVARRQMCGFGGMVTFQVAGGLAAASRIFDRLRLIQRAASLGGVESVVSIPVLTSHYGYSPEELEKAGVDPGMVRVSIGLEDPADLIADLEQAIPAS